MKLDFKEWLIVFLVIVITIMFLSAGTLVYKTAGGYWQGYSAGQAGGMGLTWDAAVEAAKATKPRGN